MKSATFLIKPASSLCNMRCRYCFYHDIASLRQAPSMGIMAQDTAKTLIQQAFAAVEPGGYLQFTFQGGEPTLAGLEFFREFVRLEKELGRSSVTVGHAIQTNGLVLDDQWAAFLKENHFLVGLSIDGNEFFHDANRLDAQGKGTWDRVCGALACLDRHQVETNLLCVVTGPVAKNPQKIYRSLRSLGNHPLQFIPCLDPMEEDRGDEGYSLKPQAYGNFLRGLFDCWYRDWKLGNYVSIRLFDDYLRILMGMAPSTCAAAGSCGNYLVVEGDGSLYPCDFYVLDQWKIGSIGDLTVEQALTAPASRRFLEEGRRRPQACRSCPYGFLCRGGCKRDWTDRGENYYCEAFRSLFAYSLPRLREMAQAASRGR